MRYLFLGLVALNIVTFSYYSYLRPPVISNSVITARQHLINPVTVENVSDELPPMIGKKD